MPKTAVRNREQSKSGSKHLRLDIQGLRAIAVGVVLLYHAGVSWLPGGFVGVDVFFVISGFLITGGIVRELRRDGSMSIKNFYIRRIARILPAATVAILATLGLTYWLMPATRWVQTGLDGIGSSLYYVNWLFAASSVDYLARDQEPSPFQHFWSLAVEEQFYIFWPALLAFVTWLALKWGFRLQKGLLITVALVAVPSLAWSVYYTATNPGGAYFTTATRIWELAIGAAFAIAAGRGFKAPKAVSAVIGWLGLAAIIYAAATYTTALPFPSYTALLPVLGAALIIWSGPTAGNAGPILALGTWPMVKIGELSYSLYLWHWPLVVIGGVVLGGLTETTGLVIVAMSIVPAWLSLKYVEKPLQTKILEAQTDGSKIASGLMMTLAAAAAAMILAVSVTPPPPPSAVTFTPQQVTGVKAKPVGAEALADGAPLEIKDTFSSITPTAVNAKDDVPVVNRNGCMLNAESTEAKVCSFGDLGSSRVIALVGDSHAAMLVPAFEDWAAKEKIRVDTYTKGACPFVAGEVEYDGQPYAACSQWVDNVTQQILATSPEAVVSAMSRYRIIEGGTLSFEASKQPLAQMISEAMKPLQKVGIKTIMLRDTPRPEVAVPDCVAKNEKSLTACALPADQVLWKDGPEVRAADNDPKIDLIDLSKAFCTAEKCPAIIEGILVYRDNNHLTATYARTLHKHLGEALTPLLAG
ncbi:acyltransferase family protein [Paenarthrobacter sp. YJN-5]|uniref:acyltransferase family protein n=1 Tax=Paenarthrobacter sp. YJN-5 TaxID=2735316 RepID=UPI0018779E0F|nr:acyltransferase family protein [Paenarthrobacter sp. YJN-5]QOT16466.1 acyltransferase [Paenarthrobacter sp. YJN-5]